MSARRIAPAAGLAPATADAVGLAGLEQGQVAAVLGRFHHVGVGLQAGVRLGCHVADFVGQLQGAGLGGFVLASGQVAGQLLRPGLAQFLETEI